MPTNKLECGKTSCKDDKCVVRCDAKIDVDLNAKPEAECCVLDKNDTRFQVALKTKVKPHCKITDAGVHQSTDDPCVNVCLFNVDVGFECEAYALNDKCNKASKRVELKVKIPTAPECRIVEICGNKHSGKREHQAAPKLVKNKQAAEKKTPSPKPTEKKTPQSFSNRNYINALSKEEKTQKSAEKLRFH